MSNLIYFTDIELKIGVVINVPRAHLSKTLVLNQMPFSKIYYDPTDKLLQN